MADEPIHERVGSGYDLGARGYELQGRAAGPKHERTARAFDKCGLTGTEAAAQMQKTAPAIVGPLV